MSETAPAERQKIQQLVCHFASELLLALTKRTVHQTHVASCPHPGTA
ncbi:MAG: hypothetical protein GKR94_22075 [Gammaproteobacteria bacterium]|nr:hypothetical protein [Gammaproteobacteria bacterium]